MNRRVVLRCGICRRKLDDVLTVRNVRPHADNRPEDLRGRVAATRDLYADRSDKWTYSCRCGRVWPVARKPLVAAAYRAVNRGENAVYAGRRDYGQPI